jgi:diguanylate cyclase (GGDEF)-like protein/PAS domain S-box-containing protein
MAADTAAIVLGAGGVLAAGVALAAWVLSARCRDRPTTAALLFCGAAGSWIVATIAWLAAGAADPGAGPSLAWGFGALAAGVAMASFPGAPPHVSGQLRTLVDGLIVAASTLLISWSLGLAGLFEGGDAQVLVLAAALAQLTVGAGSVVILTRARPQARARIAPLAAGLAALALAAWGFALVALDAAKPGAVTLCIGGPLGWALVALASHRASGADEPDEQEPGLPTRASIFVPSVPFAAAVASAAAAGVKGEFEGFLIACGGVVIVLIVMRQMLALWENISFWRRLEAKVAARTDDLRRSEARFRSLVQNSSDMITVLDARGRVEYQSPSAMTLLGYEPGDVEGVAPLELIHPHDRSQVRAAAREAAGRPGGSVAAEFRVRHRNGRWRHLDAVATNLLDDPAVGSFVVNARDITERKELEQQLTFRAFHDPLTSLANRALFGDRLAHALTRRRDRGSVAVLFCDLDQFKRVNDSLGHGSGDRLLGVVAKRLTGCLPSGNTVARLGGDEFAILLEDASEPMDAVRVAEAVLEALERPIEVDGRPVFIRASIGIAMAADAGPSAEDLLRAADVAMYSAKAAGGGGYEFFEARMHEAVTERLELEGDLRRAIAGDELELDYQPIVSLRDGSLAGVEALLRWRHPHRGRLGPGRFIEMAESTGQMVEIGGWVLRTACAQAREWRARFRDRAPLSVVVNLSGAQLQRAGLVEDVEQAIRAATFDPGALVVEVTEGIALDSETGLERLNMLHELGVRISIDDFGTGYSSLGYLRQLPVDVLKIDPIFLSGLARESSDSAIVEAILAMSRTLGIVPVAEGVERREQAVELDRLGCELAQGFLFHRPSDPGRIIELLEEERALTGPLGRARVPTRPFAG